MARFIRLEVVEVSPAAAVAELRAALSECIVVETGHVL